MATADPTPDPIAPSAHPGSGLLVVLSAMPQIQLECVLGRLSVSFPTERLLIATPDALAADSFPALRFVAAPAAIPSWTFTAADFANAYQLAQKNEAGAILMLGPESSSLGSTAFPDLANAVLTTPTDLAVPCYDLPPHTSLINSAILYPLTRALFASDVRFPLAVDLGLSMRMAERLSRAALRIAATNQEEALLWPVNEAAIAGFNVDQFEVGARIQPQPAGTDLNTMLPLVAGSLFSDIDAKAAFWQRFRMSRPASSPTLKPVPLPHPLSTEGAADIVSRVRTFQLAYTNLQEVWRLVLPPNSLLGLKRLSQTDAGAFRMPESLWARIVFDFLLAFRLRTISRGHLLGALIPLYLGWVASHMNITASGIGAEQHIEAVAAAFETDRTYLVSRWRWPDRFNP